MLWYEIEWPRVALRYGNEHGSVSSLLAVG
jgi:hypothetical protein